MIKDNLDPRNSVQRMNEIYFWTATIHSWHGLLSADEFKRIILGSLKNLSDRRLVDVFGFVIMPNHVHLLWRVLRRNGKESPQGSLLKFTAHEFKKRLIQGSDPGYDLEQFAVKSPRKSYEFWQPNQLAIRLFDLEIATQKLRYTHDNPTTPRWQLAVQPEEYRFSSAGFYRSGVDDFGFLRNLYEAFQYGF